MTEFYYPFNAIETSPDVFDRTYDAADLARAFDHLNNGVVNGLTVTAGTGLTSVLAAGQAFINGYSYVNDANLTLTHAAANATYDRIDLVVIRLDLSAREIHAAVVTGTAAASPAVPALTNTATIIEIPIARLYVRAAAATIAAADILRFQRSTERTAYFSTFDLNDVTQTGCYSGTNMLNGPSGVTTGFLWVNQYGAWNATTNILSVGQVLMDYNTGKMYSRYRASGGGWLAWRRIQTEPDTGKPYLYASKGQALVNGTQTIPSMTFNKNIGGFSDAGAAVIKVPTAGLYEIAAHCQFSGTTLNNKRFRFGFQHTNAANAVLTTQYIGGTVSIANDYFTAGGARIWEFAAGEGLAPYVDNGTGAAATLDTYVLTVTRLEDRS
jgi:hypothetical protein